jgi:hypothetical protein
MVLKVQIGGYVVRRVFMDVGSGINLIYTRILKAMNISLEWLQPTDCSFHGIVSGSEHHPLGKIKLNNFLWRKRQLPKGEARIRSHGLALAVSCNPWAADICAVHGSAPVRISRVKNPRAKWSYHGNFEVSDTCDMEFNKMVQTFSMTAEYARLKGETGHNVLPDVGRSLPDQAFDST